MGKYSSHAKYTNMDGIEVPSATTIIGLLDKPGLVDWANYMGFKGIRTKDILEKSGRIGTAVHGYIESWFTKEPYLMDPKTEKYFKSEVAIRLDSFLTWVKKQEIKHKHVEKKLVDYRYGGTVDFVGELNGTRVVLDFKTSSRVYPTMFLQLAAYTKILEDEGETIDAVGIVHIKDDKTRLVQIEREKLQPYIDTFMVLVDVFHMWFDLNEKK